MQYLFAAPLDKPSGNSASASEGMVMFKSTDSVRMMLLLMNAAGAAVEAALKLLVVLPLLLLVVLVLEDKESATHIIGSENVVQIR